MVSTLVNTRSYTIGPSGTYAGVSVGMIPSTPTRSGLSCQSPVARPARAAARAAAQLRGVGKQGAAAPPPAGAGGDDQLALGVPGAVPTLEPRVAGQRAVHGGGEHVATAGRAAVLQSELGLLRERADAVGHGRR